MDQYKMQLIQSLSSTHNYNKQKKKVGLFHKEKSFSCCIKMNASKVSTYITRNKRRICEEHQK